MDEIETPTFVTDAGARVIVDASPSGLVVRSRSALGADSSATIPVDVALVLLADATALAASLRGE